MSDPAPKKRLSTLESLYRALTSWRTASVTLLSFASGLPLGLVWIAIPDWMRSIGVDIRVVGLLTLAQAPWTFKFLWSPFMDRYVPPFLGRRRGWMVIAQIGLAITTMALAGLGGHPDTPWVVGALALAIAFASATQDIAIDAYAVDVLRPEEHGIAVGARVALYRAAMFVAGGLSITLAAKISWPVVFVALGIVYVPMAVLTFYAPEAEEKIPPPRTIKDAVWYPFVGFLARHRAVEILLFVIFYKFADNLGGALLRPFLIDMHYDEFHRGVALATIAVFATVIGTVIGGVCTAFLGLGHSLWFFGIVQIVSNVGYIFVARDPEHPSVPLMYAAIGFEQITQGMGTGAFNVLLMRLTQKRFSATQYALFSSLFGIPRALAGPIAGYLVHYLGWTLFFWLSMAAGIPGLVLLARFVPPGVKEPVFTVVEVKEKKPLTKGIVIAWASGWTLLGAGTALLSTAFLGALSAFRKEVKQNPDAPVRFWENLQKVLQPQSLTDWVTLVGIVVFGVILGLFAAAVVAARRGAVQVPDEPTATGA